MSYDAETIDRLLFQHGARAAAIVQGADDAANADLASWARLGGLSEAEFATVRAPRRTYRPWTCADERRLERMWSKKTKDEIAVTLGRTTDSVASKANALGLRHGYWFDRQGARS